MSYRNKTYVIFDGDNDMKYYLLMKAWKEHDNIDFNFYDAHDIRPLTNAASDDTIFRRLRERFSSAKQAIVLIGENTKNLRKFVPWEIEIAKDLNLPIVAVNVNGERRMDASRCPGGLKSAHAVHVAFKMKIIQHALDHFPPFHGTIRAAEEDWWYYTDDVYATLGL